MPRTLSPDVIAEKDKDYNWPIELYQIFLDEETLYYAMFPEDINFYDENGNSQIYYAAAIKRDTVNKDNQIKPDTTTVTFDNVAREFSAYIANTEFVGRQVTIWKVFKNALESPENYIEIFTKGIIDSVSIDEQNLRANIVSNLDALDIELPGETYQVNCRFVFGDEACGVSIPSKTGIIDSVFGAMINDSDITESADYWKHGSINVGKESRKITASGTGFIELEYPISNAQAGDSYDLKAGCDYSYDQGHGCTFWSNTNFYGGFLDIPKIRNIRRVD